MAKRGSGDHNGHGSSRSPKELIEWARVQYELLDKRLNSGSPPSNPKSQNHEEEHEPVKKLESGNSSVETVERIRQGLRLPVVPTNTQPSSTGRELITLSSSQLTVTRSVTLGHDAQTSEEVSLGEFERYGGLYVLGQARSGKSNLLISMALQDMEQERGLLFIDPHVDAITDILARLPPHREADVILLDPSEDKYTFGINVLDRQNENIDDTFNRTKGGLSRCPRVINMWYRGLARPSVGTDVMGACNGASAQFERIPGGFPGRGELRGIPV